MTRFRRLLAAAVLTAAALAPFAATPAYAAPSAPTTGSITGTFTDAAGAPVAGIGAIAKTLRHGGPTYSARTDAAGRYTITGIPAGQYRVEFEHSSAPGNPFVLWRQWVPGAISEVQATTFTVVAGGTLVVDERGLPTGSLSITYRDPATGEAVQAFCADISGAMFATEGCTETGTVVLADVRAAYYVVFASTSDGSGFGITDATVVEGQTTEVVVEQRG